MHISAKGFNKLGWAVISTFGGVEGAWTYRKIYALEPVDNGRIANLAHTYNCADTYFQETQAVVNRDFSGLYFNSTSNNVAILKMNSTQKFIQSMYLQSSTLSIFFPVIMPSF